MGPWTERTESTLESCVRRSRIGIVVALLAASFFGPGVPAQSQGAPGSPVQRFVGTYRCRLADGGEAAIREAVERVVSQMVFLTAGIARRRLIESNPPIPRITIAAHAEGMVIDYTARRRNTTTRLGVFTDNPAADGGRVQVKHEIVGDRIRESFRQGAGHGVTLLALSPDGNRLSLQMTISSRHLPDDVVFGMPYERVR